MNSNKNRKNEYKSPSIPPINNKLEKKNQKKKTPKKHERRFKSIIYW